VGSVRRGRRRGRRRVRIGAPDPTLTSVAGMITVTELCDRLDTIGRLNAAIGPLKQRRRGHTAGEVLVGIAAAQRFSDGQWRRWRPVWATCTPSPACLATVAPARAAALCEQVTIDLDTTDVEVYGRHKRGVAYNH